MLSQRYELSLERSVKSVYFAYISQILTICWSLNDSKIYQSLSCLDVYQGNRFIKFLQSPYFNRKDLITELVIYLLDCKRSEVEPDKLRFWNQFIDKPYDDPTFRRLCSETIDQLEQFVVVETLKSNPELYTHLLLSGLHSTEIQPLLKSAIRKVNNRTVQKLNSANLIFDFLIEKDLRDLDQADLKRYERSTLDILSDKLDTYYIIEKLRIYSLVHWQKSFIKEDYNIKLINQILDFLKTNPYPDNYIINIYYQNLLMLSNPEEESHFSEYKRLLFAHASEFESFESFRLIYNAINFSIRKLNQGQRNYSREIWELYKFAIEKNILTDAKNFDHWDYRNIVTSALQEREFAWTYQFIHEYKEFIEEEYRENAFNFNLALLSFYEKEFEKAIHLLNSVEYTDLTYNLNAKALLLASYYELDEIEALYSAIDSFYIYLKRQASISDVKRDHYLRLPRYIKRMLNASSKEKLTRLKESIQSEQVVSKPWLLEKVNDLLGENVHA